MHSSGMDDIEIPAFLRKLADGPDELIPASELESVKKVEDTHRGWADVTEPAPTVTIDEIVKTLNTVSLTFTNFRQALQQTLKLRLPPEYSQIIIDLTKDTKDSATSWALLFEWLFEHYQLESLLAKHTQRLLRNQLKLVSEKIRSNSFERFEIALGRKVV
jgi:hypothetical protein